MLLSAGPRKFALTAHVAASVGWAGAVAVFLVLALTGLNSDDGELVRGAYLAMDLITRSVIVPLALMSVATGIVQGLGTKWGLFRHYWVVVKLVVTVIAAVVLLSAVEPITQVADAARLDTFGRDAMRAERTSLVIHSGGGLVTLLVPTVLSIYKPRGVTRFGRRRATRAQAARR